MSVIALTIDVDLKPFEDRLRHISEALRPAAANVITSVARDGRAIFMKVTKLDAVGGGGSSFSKYASKQVSRPTAASAGNMTSTMVIRPATWGVSPLVKAMAKGGRFKRGGGTISTHMLTGGGSANNTKSGFFQLEANGGRVVLIRRGSVAGLSRKEARKLDRSHVKRIYSEMPITAMAQEKSRPRRAYDNLVNSTLGYRMSNAVQQVLDGAPPPAVTSTASEE